MARDPKKVYNLEFLAGELEKARLPNGFEAFGYHRIASILHSVLEISGRIPRNEREHIISRTISNAAAAGKVTAPALEAGLKKAQGEFFATRPFKAVLAVPVSLALPPAIHTKKMFRGQLTLARWLPRRFVTERASAEFMIAEDSRQHPGYSWLLSRYAGRSIQDAYYVALRHVDLLRAFWNFQINRHLIIRLRSGSAEPVNKFRLGKVHTLHAPGGKAVTHMYWYDPTFVPRTSTHVAGGEWTGINTVARKLTEGLRVHPYREALENAFIRYVRALDFVDFEAAFIKLWALLETLTATPHANYDTTVERTLFLFDDQERELMRNTLEHLRDQRNSAVHNDPGSEHAETFVYQVKECVEMLLMFHLNTGRHYKSMGAACLLLEQPTTKPDLLNQIRRAYHSIRLARRAMRFRRLLP